MLLAEKVSPVLKKRKKKWQYHLSLLLPYGNADYLGKKI